MKINKHILYSIFTIVFLTGCSVSLAADVTPPPNLVQPPPEVSQPSSSQPIVLPMIAPDIQNGAQIYEEKCEPCHGSSGMGDGIQSGQLPNPVTPIGDFSIAKDSKPLDWYSVVTVGNLEKFMPGFQSLSDRERWDVTAYALTLSLSDDLIGVGKIVFDENCIECHTSDSLPLENASRMAEVSITDIQLIVDNGVEPEMPGFSELLSQEEILAVSSYVRYLGFQEKSQISQSDENNEETQPEIENSEEPLVEFSNFNIVGEISSFEGIPSDLVVSLSGYDGMDMVLQQTTEVSEDGSYSFLDLENVPGRVYQAAIIIDGIQHTSEVIHDPEIDDQGNVDVFIEIKKITSDSSSLYAERMHVFFDFISEGTIQIVEMYVIQNPTDAVIIPEDSTTPVIEFKLPAGAQNLQFEQGVLGQDYIQLEDGFGVLQSFGANASVQILFAYDLPYLKSLDLDIVLPIPVNASIFMLPSDLVDFSSDQLTFSGERDIQGMRIQTYSGGEMDSDSAINLKLSGKVKQTTDLIQEGNTLSIIIGVGGLLVALGFAMFFIRRKIVANPENLDDSSNEEDLESLLDAVIALDDAYGSGELPENAYLNRRNELTKLIKLRQNSEE
jgi:mono/diheme cytochrome c family protein